MVIPLYNYIPSVTFQDTPDKNMSLELSSRSMWWKLHRSSTIFQTILEIFYRILIYLMHAKTVINMISKSGRWPKTKIARFNMKTGVRYYVLNGMLFLLANI